MIPLDLPSCSNCVLRLSPITRENQDVYLALSDSYEAEFAPLTGARPEPSGHYPISTPAPADSTWGWILYANATPCGFAIVHPTRKHWDIAEFFIHPDWRKNDFGYTLATHLFTHLHGTWQIRQLITATRATQFWHHVLKRNAIVFTECHENDPHWGAVRTQFFEIKP